MNKDLTKNSGFKKRLLKKLSQVGISSLTAALLIGSTPAGALDPLAVSQEIAAAEGGKAALNEALKIAKSKPALSVAAAITCAACVPVAGAAASPGLCIACGILIAKVVG